MSWLNTCLDPQKNCLSRFFFHQIPKIFKPKCVSGYYEHMTFVQKKGQNIFVCQILKISRSEEFHFGGSYAEVFLLQQ